MQGRDMMFGLLLPASLGAALIVGAANAETLGLPRNGGWRVSANTPTAATPQSSLGEDTWRWTLEPGDRLSDPEQRKQKRDEKGGIDAAIQRASAQGGGRCGGMRNDTGSQVAYLGDRAAQTTDPKKDKNSEVQVASADSVAGLPVTDITDPTTDGELAEFATGAGGEAWLDRNGESRTTAESWMGAAIDYGALGLDPAMLSCLVFPQTNTTPYVWTDLFSKRDPPVPTTSGRSADQVRTAQALFAEDVARAPSPVPLPAALPLFVSALTGLGVAGWRRRGRNTASQS